MKSAICAARFPPWGAILARVEGLAGNQDFEALQTLIQGLEKIAALELRASPEDRAIAVDVIEVLDELRVLIEPSFREDGISVEWQIAGRLPLVSADSYGLLQVFLNLARNSQRAVETCARKQLRITAAAEEQVVAIRFEDSGAGVPFPDQLFRPFQPGADGTGLGLYVSRAIVRSFRGELRYEARPTGSCFAVLLAPVSES